MKKRILYILLSLTMSVTMNAQPYIYYSIQLADTTYGQYEKIFRYNLATSTEEDFLPQQNLGLYAWPVWDPSQSYLIINVYNWANTLYDCSDTSDHYELEEFFNKRINALLYSQQRNKLYIFSEDEQLSVFDLSTQETISTSFLPYQTEYNHLAYPRRNSFFSSDLDHIYFYCIDTLTNADQVWTYSLETNEVSEKRDLINFSEHSECDGYNLTFGRNGIGIIEAEPFYNNPTKDFYYNLYDFDSDIIGETIYHNGFSEAYFAGNGEYLIILDTFKDDSLRYYHTGELEIYNPQNAQLLKTITLPSGGRIYTFDYYPNNIYYVIDIEEPTRQIYTLKMDSIFNVLDLTSLNPSSAIVNSPPFTLTVNGHGFDTLSTVYFNEVGKTTTYVSDSVLTAEIDSADISVVGNCPVWVTDHWGTSDTLIFTVIPQLPVLTSISPSLALVYDKAVEFSPLTITLSGNLFTDSSIVYFDNQPYVTTYISDSVVAFQISDESYLINTGNYPIWVSNYGIISETLYLSVVDKLDEALRPIVECVQDNQNGTYTAFFGYDNNYQTAVYIHIGLQNNVYDEVSEFYGGQPVIFLPGRNENVFTKDFNSGGTITWLLNTESVIADEGSILCP